jgi:hypothetical protein
MKKVPNITSVENRTGFRERLVEKFVQQNLPPSIRKKSRLSGMGRFTERFKEIEYCAAETPVEGTIKISFAPKHSITRRRICASIDSRFFVFFTRDDRSDYQVAWSCSLS